MGGRGWRRPWAGAGVAALLSGCSVLGGAVGVPPVAGGIGGSCGSLPSGACTDVMNRAAAGHPGATMVDVECAGSCTRAGGAGTATVTLADGRTVREPFSYVGDPAPLPPPACINLARDVCLAVARSRVDDLSPTRHVVAIKVTCTRVPCTQTKGEATIDVQLGGGGTESGGMGWDGGLP